MEQITREEMISILKAVKGFDEDLGNIMYGAIIDPLNHNESLGQRIDNAIAALQAAEPVVYQRRMRPTWDSRHPWTNWEDCSKGTYDDCLRVPFLHDWEHQVRALFTLPYPPAKAQVPMFRSSADGEHWPRIGCKYLVKLNGVLQEEIFEFDQGDDGAFSGGEYFWSRDDLDECPAFNADADEWLPLSALLSTSKAQVPEGLRVGNLVTMNQDEYPGLGEWFTQIWCGDDVVARIYGKDREQIRERIDAMLTTSPAVQGEPVGWQYYQFGKWWNGDNLTRGQQKNIKEAGHPIRELYAAPQPSPDVSALVEALELARDYVVEHLTKRREEFKGYEKLGGIAEIEADLAMIEEAIALHRQQEEAER